jgi:hypothetical protein
MVKCSLGASHTIPAAGAKLPNDKKNPRCIHTWSNFRTKGSFVLVMSLLCHVVYMIIAFFFKRYSKACTFPNLE